MPPMPLDLAHPILAAVALAMAAALAIVARRRGIALPTGAMAAGLLGALLIALVAGGPRWRMPDRAVAVVMVDLSASTRGAQYRDPANLRRRIGELLDGAPHRIVYFAATHVDSPPAAGADLPGDQTLFDPPADAPAVVLFSDGRFDLPAAAPPVFAVIDPALTNAADGAVRDLDANAGRIVADIAIDGAARTARFAGAAPDESRTIDSPGARLSAALDLDADRVGVRLDPGDLWPENDAMAADVIPADARPWWVSDRPAPAGFVAIDPSRLAGDPAAYLGASVIVLDNIPADALPATAAERLMQYVRDLGGAVVLGGGDRAFASGGYANTALESLSPLSSVPPTPTTRWLIVADASGSMAELAGDGGASRWDRAIVAVRAAVDSLPPEDPVRVGSFARDSTWWAPTQPARLVRRAPLPPPTIVPTGPTNLDAALEDLSAAAAAAGDMPTRCLLLTDAQAPVSDPAGVAERLDAKGVHLHVLLIGDGPGAAALRLIAGSTGGSLVPQSDPARWADAMGELVRAASANPLRTDPVALESTPRLGAWPTAPVAPWNRLWLKPEATALADVAGEGTVMIAEHRVGVGRVIAIAHRAAAGDLAKLARRVERAPRDPRFTVIRRRDRGWRILVESTDPADWNDVHAVVLRAIDGTDTLLPRVGPGRFAVTLPAGGARLLRVIVEGRLVDWIAIPRSYPIEFDAVGTDVKSLAELAARTGGAVVGPDFRRPLKLPRPTRAVDVTPPAALLAALSLAGALALWRRG